MFNIGEYRRHAQRLSDHLPWAALIAPGVMLNKDGSFQTTLRFRGPDVDSGTPQELMALRAQMNNALRRLGSGWALVVEAQPAALVEHRPRSRRDRALTPAVTRKH